MITFAAARRAEDARGSGSTCSMGRWRYLLSLIEQRQLDVLTVRLGDLAPAFLDALAGLETGRLPLLSAFVGVSAQLILIKSRAVLPRPPADDRVRAPRLTRPTRRKNCAGGCCCTSNFATPVPAWRPLPTRAGRCSIAKRKRHSPRAVATPGRRRCPSRRAPAGRRPALSVRLAAPPEPPSDGAAPRRDPRATRRPDPPRAAQDAKIVLQELLQTSRIES